ncbi:hypothetical protein [Paraburkholderia caribensis]|uniref:hypothetical protein n=1 Tax=Paraburkholderia caribensis TaxID=75105 RepID=UPI00159184FC|nr:hypothetical protein [Paraburkholderia caribensis]
MNQDMTRSTLSHDSTMPIGKSLAGDQSSTLRRKRAPTGRFGAISALLVLFVSLIEIPFELPGYTGSVELVALLISKAIYVLVVSFMAMGSRVARIAFMLICGTSVLAILPAIPTEHSNFHMGFELSVLECIVKLAALILIQMGI